MLERHSLLLQIEIHSLYFKPPSKGGKLATGEAALDIRIYSRDPVRSPTSYQRLRLNHCPPCLSNGGRVKPQDISKPCNHKVRVI